LAEALACADLAKTGAERALKPAQKPGADSIADPPGTPLRDRSVTRRETDGNPAGNRPGSGVNRAAARAAQIDPEAVLEYDIRVSY